MQARSCTHCSQSATRSPPATVELSSLEFCSLHPPVLAQRVLPFGHCEHGVLSLTGPVPVGQTVNVPDFRLILVLVSLIFHDSSKYMGAYRLLYEPVLHHLEDDEQEDEFERSVQGHRKQVTDRTIKCRVNHSVA
jgi:hypothetical protein